jgi:hypothetical protein
MSTRLRVRLAIAGLAFLIYLIVRLSHPTRVTFSPANMSIDPGKGWKELAVPKTAAVCSPRLVSKSAMINALLLGEEFTDVKAAAEKVKANLVASGRAAAENIAQEDFTTASGLAGVHLSYSGKSSQSNVPDVRSHHFITRNMHGRCVSIGYLTSPALESSNVIASISRTLRVE